MTRWFRASLVMSMELATPSVISRLASDDDQPLSVGNCPKCQTPRPSTGMEAYKMKLPELSDKQHEVTKPTVEWSFTLVNLFSQLRKAAAVVPSDHVDSRQDAKIMRRFKDPHLLVEFNFV